MRDIILVSILLLLSSSARAEWVKVDSAGPVTSYFNSDTIHRDGNIATLSKLFDFKLAQSAANGRMMKSLIDRNE